MTDSIPYGTCHCGCGQRTRIAPQSSTRFGWVKGEPMRFVRGHARRLNLEPPNPSGLCMCGCGEPAPIAPHTSRKLGWVAGQPLRFIHNHHHARRRPDVNPGGICECGCGETTEIFDGLHNRFVKGHRVTDPLEIRFWAKVERTDGCWWWRASLTPNGYGQIAGGKGRPLLAHRVAYELLIGPIPEGLDLDHLCFNRACVNPGHLEPVTHAENTRRAAVRMWAERHK